MNLLKNNNLFFENKQSSLQNQSCINSTCRCNLLNFKKKDKKLGKLFPKSSDLSCTHS